ncbi:alpha/beta hydrolase [Mycobacterium intermedium]|uniref:Alpha/beta hydrolase n=1 Tax=Mycobacterium intermedium TaxID=28445 RepID=A0A1E3S811_MYCIE|nr:alpha/beta hydrolase [Mycobacterium intermedium]MCV6966094.1 alpha/beta hydrolase [Mycobacterium intermedium]ODQ98224.1 alpha/beta hydrolase [Mycobacterium intermedium]OPE50183.1 alpha/beta hydrolase [Mycobacterium intermedium]ORA96873.1 alpha/beta hydrolase [Mycobacterium intermedium]
MACLLTAAATAGLVAACSRGAPDRTSYAPAPCPSPNFPGVPEADLDANYSCGYLTVPENRDDPKSRTIRILVARVRAVSDKPKPDPIVFLAGGPGGAGTLSAPGVVADGMNADRDVIFVNQRGTLHDDPHLGCPEMDEFTARAVDLVLQDSATADLDAASVAACRNRLAPSGVHLASYNSRENAADIAALRMKLGIDQWNVYGVSYGTDLAQQLLRAHPEGIRSMVLDSVVPPSINLVDRWWQAPAAGLAAIFRACADQPRCAAAYPDLPGVFLDTVNKLSRTPLKVDTTRATGESAQVTIDGAKVVPLLLQWSADPANVVDIPRLIYALSRGDGTLAASGILAAVPLPGQRGLLGAGLALGAYCQEMTNWTTPDEALTQARAAMPGLPDSVLRLTPTGSWIFRECEAWGLGRSDTADRLPVHSKIPVLIMSGSFDAGTAPQWLREVTPSLSNSLALRFPGVGHAVLSKSRCAQSIMTAFLNDPRVDVDQSCIASMTFPTFSLPG